MGRFEFELPPQHQDRMPAIEAEMEPRPIYDDPDYKPGGRLTGKVALITGGDSGIGRAVAVLFAKEGADVAIVYLDEHDDAKESKTAVERAGRSCLLVPGDVGDEAFAEKAVRLTVEAFEHLDIVVNCAAVQYWSEDITELTEERVVTTFRTNVYGTMWIIKHAVPHLGDGSAIVNSTSITAYRGSGHLLEYSATKGALLALTRSLSASLKDAGIRVNAVAPGPVWTPLIVGSFPAEAVASFGKKEPLGRAAQPVEVAPAYLFLASREGSYFTGQVLHPNGGEIVGA